MAMLLSTLVVAGCAAGNGTAQPSGSASATHSAPATGGPVAACVVGDWQSTEVIVNATGPLAGGTVTGGRGVNVKVGVNGQTEVDFTGMDPVKFSGTVLNTPIKGQFVHSGKAFGQIRTGDSTSTSGPWEPVGVVNWADVKVTVDLTEPVQVRPFENIPITQATGEGANQSGGVVDVDPVLGKGTYECGTGTLALRPDDNKGVGWRLARKP